LREVDEDGENRTRRVSIEMPVGSSASTQAGRVTIARAMAVRWRSPPDNSVG